MSRKVRSNLRVKRKSAYRGGRGTSAYQRKARELKASPDGQFCWICGAEIDRTLPPEMYNDPRYFTVDHDPPLSQGGSLLEGMKPAHKGCNSAAGRALQLGNLDAYAADFDELPIVPDERTGGFTRTPERDPGEPNYVENSRQW